MPRTIERQCNLTLSRAEWSVLLSLLDWCGVVRPEAIPVKQAIRTALQATDAADVSLERPCDKWSGVVSMVFDRACKSREGRALYDAMRRQIQAAETEDF